MIPIDSRLREHVHLLGELLGSTMREQHGAEFLEKIERIRKGAKAARRGSADGRQQLTDTLDQLPEDELLPVARGFNQFLNLANIADQYHLMRRRGHDEEPAFEEQMLASVLERLQVAGHNPKDLSHVVADLDIELVLTAHPTEVSRRTLIMKYDIIAQQLAALDHTDLTEVEREKIIAKLRSLISEVWHTTEIRSEQPTPVDEARWGFAVIERSLWQAIPNVLRHVDHTLVAAGGQALPITATPIRFATWMGGDRDGNPNVTARVTKTVLLLARWIAADLFLRDISKLTAELSMQNESSGLS